MTIAKRLQKKQKKPLLEVNEWIQQLNLAGEGFYVMLSGAGNFSVLQETIPANLNEKTEVRFLPGISWAEVQSVSFVVYDLVYFLLEFFLDFNLIILTLFSDESMFQN